MPQVLYFNVRQARMYADISIEQMAEKLDISRQTYVKYENNPGSLSYETLTKISEITQVPIENLKL